MVSLVVKNPPANAGDARDVGLIPGLGRSPGVENGNQLLYSCLKNSMDRRAWHATVLGVHGLRREETWFQCQLWLCSLDCFPTGEGWFLRSLTVLLFWFLLKFSSVGVFIRETPRVLLCLVSGMRWSCYVGKLAGQGIQGGGSLENQSNHGGWLTQVGITPGCMEPSREWEIRQRARLLAYVTPATQILSSSSERRVRHGISRFHSDMVGGIAKPKQADSLPAKVLNPAEDPEAGTSVLLGSVLNNINSVPLAQFTCFLNYWSESLH